MDTNSLLTTFILWVVNISFIAAVMPQIYMNYRNRTTKGLSDFYLVGYFNGYAINFMYVFALNFHLAYKIRAILAVIAIGYMILQRFIYDSDLLSIKKKRLYSGNFIFIISISVLIFLYPIEGGHLAGWALVGIWTLYQFPQIFKLYRDKSVEGFSLLLVSLIGVGNIIELIVAYFLKFPIQNHLIAIRGIIIYVIFLLQFWNYKFRYQVQLNLKNIPILFKDKNR